MRDNKGRFKKGSVGPNKGHRQYHLSCKNCGIQIETSDNRKRFCSHSCSMKLQWKNGKKGHVAWNKGKPMDEKVKDKLSKINYKGVTKMVNGRSEYWWRCQARKLMNISDGNIVVHHKDSDVTNNSKDNLMVMSRADHTRLHHFQGDIHGVDAI